MHDTLKYLQCHPYDRRFMSEKITFSIFYAYNERYILPFSHDEVVHGKKTIIDKLNGSYEEKFSQARLLYLYMMTHPGKKLNFMGNEIAMFREWDEKREMDWNLMQIPAHNRFHRYMEEINRCYSKKNALWELDHTYDGFKWVDCQCDNPCVFSYTRTGKSGTMLLIFNFSEKETIISPKLEGKVHLLIHTGWDIYGGTIPKSQNRSFVNTIPPFSAMLYDYILEI